MKAATAGNQLAICGRPSYPGGQYTTTTLGVEVLKCCAVWAKLPINVVSGSVICLEHDCALDPLLEMFSKVHNG